MRRADVGVIGGGVVGVAVALALARRGADVVLWEAEPALGLAASGTNAGLLVSGFDGEPGALETRLLRRSAALRPAVMATLGIPLLRTGARMVPLDGADRAALDRIAATAAANGVRAELGPAGLHLPEESVTDPVAHVLALGAAAAAHGADIRLGARVVSLRAGVEVGTSDGAVRCDAVVNCAGLHADTVARLAGDDGLRIVPRKGEFLVFAPPAPLREILLPVPTARTRGVLVFPTVDGMVVAGPTAVDAGHKADWRVRPEAEAEIRGAARRLLPALDGAEPVAAYAGLRPAGDGVNYVIERSRALPGLVHAAAIRSTGLSASLGIAAHVVALLGFERAPEAPLRRGPAAPAEGGPWWRRAAAHRGSCG